VHLFTDDGDGVQDPLLMRRALEYAADLGDDGGGIVLAQHCEVRRLTEGAVMHEGHCCSKFGLPGWPSLAEELMVYRDIELVRITGAPVHILHLSTAGSVELVRRAKADGLPVTAEATPHHISLTDELLAGYSALYKVNPPLRTMADVEAVRAGLADGTIDAIATDHAPHAPETKEQPLDQAPPGMLGLETALGVSLASLLDTGMTIADVVAALSWKPAAIAGVAAEHGRPVAPGEPANLTVFDPDRTWQVVPAQLASKSKNTPYVGRELRGMVTHTILRGQPTVIEGTAHEMTAREGQLVLADGTTFEGEAIGADPPEAPPPARSCSTRRSPATRRSSPTRATPGRSSPSPTPTSATTASTPPTTSPAPRSAAA
jgi:dihydroorotase